MTDSPLAMDDSGPPVVHYGMHVPAATSMPTGTEVYVHTSQQEDSYQQIIPGQNSLPGAQQVRVAVKHTNQIPEFPEHLRQISLGEEIKNISYAIADRNTSFIPQVDGIVDSRDSLDRTPDRVDLTESPVKHTNSQK